MVKYQFKFFIPVFLFAAICFAGCTIDFLGFFVSSDLDDRLKDRDNFVLLDADGRKWRELDLGNEDFYSFLVVTDTHLENGETFGFHKFANAVTKANKEGLNVKFAVHLGDVTQHGIQEDIDNFIKTADSLGVPIYPVIGNHDFYFGNWHIWRDSIGSTNYRIDGIGGSTSVTLFILDSGNSFFGKEQLDWLEREIKTTKEKDRVFVFTHAPLFVEGPVDMQQLTDTKERARIVSILKNKCDMMFMGHLHKNMYNKAGNVEYYGVAAFIEDKVSKEKETYGIVTVRKTGVSFKMEKL